MVFSWWRKKQKKRPWEEAQPILSQIRTWDGADELTLSDEPEAGPNTIRFVAGALDGVFTHHVGQPEERDEAEMVSQMVSAVKTLIERNDDEAREAFYSLAMNESLVQYVDTIIEELDREKWWRPDRFATHARWLLTASCHREPLKLGLTLLGVAGSREDLDDILTIARHEEFTLFAAVAVANIEENPVDTWWQMARKVKGWGKIHLVERLSQHAEDSPELRLWLLEEGCKNAVMEEYVAFRCAEAGNLASAIAADEVGDDLLDGACAIIGALLQGGPAEDMDNYQDGAAATYDLIRHLNDRCNSLRRLNTVRLVDEWLSLEEPEVWSAREERGWTARLRSHLTATCAAIFDRPEWPEKIRAAYAGDLQERFYAWRLSYRVGVDLWDDGFARLKEDPLDSSTYYDLLETDRLERVDAVVRFAEKALPLKEIGSGPEDSLGLGSDYQPHRCLEFVLQKMQNTNVFSDAVVTAGLRCPVVRLRNRAIEVLSHHHPDIWGASVRQAIKQTLKDEPRDDVRERLRDATEGKV